ncbi:hypothetical protein CGLO_12450 [Colletotrichum gloeosporioides Cg-14]|uniref:Uncharacterized protein n=1 Tax=Colletotrichum gloeosporioides (strain Cg-14) TaxID=1237896 RepID=T0L9J5_COLGC|nr:hypothetical protein CGLO_12450 [Colletotrichum gloeosporioides Cg-14]
MAELLEEEID